MREAATNAHRAVARCGGGDGVYFSVIQISLFCCGRLRPALDFCPWVAAWLTWVIRGPHDHLRSFEGKETVMHRLSTFAFAAALALLGSAAFAGPVGPSPYLSFNDSPFKGLNLPGFHLEDFEDHLLNVPGVTGSPGGAASVGFVPSIHDSADGD